MEAEIDNLTFCEELMIFSAGPFANLLMIVLTTVVTEISGIDITFFAYTNIYMLIINLLPVLPLDGGRILRSIIKDLHIECVNMKIISVFVSVFIIFVGLYLVVNTGINFSLLIIGIFLLNYTNIEFNKASNIVNILKSKKEIYRPDMLVLNYNLSLYSVIKKIDYEKLIIIFVIDDDMNLVTITNNIKIIESAYNGNGYKKIKDIYLN